MPDEGYQRPSQTDATGMIVTHVSEDGASRRTFDFSDLDCPPALLGSLVRGFATATGQGGRWRSPASARAGSDSLREFIRSLSTFDPAPTCIDEVGPEVWWAWRADVERRRRWPGTVNHVRAVLTDTPGLPELTRKALRGRTRKPKSRLYNAYSRDEFQRIRAAASAIVHTGQQRIDANLATLRTYREGEEASDAPTARVRGQLWTAGGILDHLARTGTVPPGAAGTGRSGECRALLNLDGAATINEALFPNSAEILSIAFLLTCSRGYNPSVIDRLTVDTDRADDRDNEAPVHVLHLDKPRRGPAARYSDESLTGSAGRIIDRAANLTAQARTTLALLGAPTDSLLLYRAANNYGGEGPRVFRTELAQPHAVYPRWHDIARLVADDGTPLRVTFQRLRLTEQVLNTKPRQNSPAVSESIYRQPDEQTRRQAAAAIIRGQSEAVEHAVATVRMRTLSERDIAAGVENPQLLSERLGVPIEKVRLLLSGSLNTATSACVDFNNSPFSDDGQPCRASFLACLGCQNAVATPSHLPRLVVLSEALERIGSAVTAAVWQEDYRRPHAQLAELLIANTTIEQREAARRLATADDEAAIERLLTRGLDG